MKIRWLNAFTVSVLITLLSLYIYSLNLTIFKHLELKAYDFKMSLRSTRPVSGQVVIVAIDEHSLKREGRWPWPVPGWRSWWTSCLNPAGGDRFRRFVTRKGDLRFPQ